jgi:hypothetical protein
MKICWFTVCSHPISMRLLAFRRWEQIGRTVAQTDDDLAQCRKVAARIRW